MFKLPIAITCFLKLDTLKNTLRSLENLALAKGASLELYFCVDRCEDPKFMRDREEVLALVKGYQTPHGKHVLEPQSGLGPFRAREFLADAIFPQYELALFVEDDAVLASDALLWIDKTKQLLREKDVYFLALESVFFNRKEKELPKDLKGQAVEAVLSHGLAALYMRATHHTPTCFVASKDKWGLLTVALGKTKVDHDINAYMMKNGFYTIFPVVPRCKDTGVQHPQSFSVVSGKRDNIDYKNTYLLSDELKCDLKNIHPRFLEDKDFKDRLYGKYTKLDQAVVLCPPAGSGFAATKRLSKYEGPLKGLQEKLRGVYRSVTGSDMSIKTHRLIVGWGKAIGKKVCQVFGWSLSDEECVRRSGFFDQEWYLVKYPDVARARRDPLEHYLKRGGFEGRCASPYFDGGWYLREYPDDAQARENPLVHYLRRGKKEGRKPLLCAMPTCPLLMQIQRLQPGRLRDFALWVYGGLGDRMLQNLSDIQCVKRSGLFDGSWYLAKYPDVAEKQRNPLEHYLKEGGSERRFPGPNFDSDSYLRAYPDVAETGENPLVHYLRKGKKAGRKIGSRDDYSRWIELYDTLTGETRAKMRQEIEGFSSRPLISVLMPVYNPKLAWLKEAIESVRNQIYPHWELCIADDASTDEAIRPLLEQYAREDARIKVVYREKNGHISAASNSALELVTGEWVALLDHDDLLSEHALFWVAETLQKHPEACLIYSDEDKLDERGKRNNPYFKSDWNYDLFLSHNMICHLGIYRTSMLRTLDGFRLGFEGAQDYDLVLRCLAVMGADKIQHIPRVLYHWRMHVGSVASNVAAKPYAIHAGKRALDEYFGRQRILAWAEEKDIGYRVHYALPEIPPKISLIIPTRNELLLLRLCVESILQKTIYPNYEILIIDNGSDDPDILRYFEELGPRANVRVLRDERPFNFSALNNAGVEAVQGELIGLINNDVEVISPEWLSEMASLALQPGVGAVGARLWYPDRTMQHGGIITGIGGIAGHSHKRLPQGKPGYFRRAISLQSFSAVTGACLILRKAIYQQVGGLNEKDLPVAFNDVDLCLRIRAAGYRNLWTPYAELWHRESSSRGFEETLEKRARFVDEMAYMKKRWGNQLLNDPAYSPNLTLDWEDFSFAWPPRFPEKATSPRE